MDSPRAFNRDPKRISHGEGRAEKLLPDLRPSMSHLRFYLLLAVAVVAAWWLFGGNARRPAPGIVAPEFPQQSAVIGPAGAWVISGDYKAGALAEYRIHARVLGVERYRFDIGAKIAPVDLALGWGKMSDWAVYHRLNVSQRGRYYLYEWGAEGPPIPAAEIITHSANNHIIPADAEVANALATVRVDDVIWMEGQLVEVHGPGGFVWKSSLTREDTGGGACELFRVCRLIVEPEEKSEVTRLK